MKISLEYKDKALNFQSLRLVIEELKKIGYYVSDKFSSYALTYDEERIETSNFLEFLEIWQKRGNTQEFDIALSLGPENQSKRLGWVHIRTSYTLVVSCDLPDYNQVITILGFCERVFELKRPEKRIEKEDEEEEQERRRTVFLAHSLDEKGKSYAYTVMKFLELLGFKVITGAGFAPERVSTKVKRRLKNQEVVMAIWSEKEDFTWLIQESSGATFLEKPLILLVEEGLELKPGVLGDIEHIKFPKDHISESFISIMEGLTELGYSFR